MPPPLSPTTLGYALNPAAMASPVRIECFLDLICPFSRKMFMAVTTEVLPKIGDKVLFIMHQVPQPWHAQGSYVHAAALAVKDVASDAYPKYVRAIYDAFNEGRFADRDTWDKSQAQINSELCDLAAATGIDRAAVEAKLAMNAASEDVTPTVFVNGLEAGIVSSGWTGDQWLKFLEPMGADGWTGTKL